MKSLKLPQQTELLKRNGRVKKEVESKNLSDRSGIVYNEKVIETEFGEMTLWSYFIQEKQKTLIKDYPPVQSTIVDLYIYSEITDVDNYIQVFHLIRNLESTDDLIIHINSPGGDMATLLAFMNIIQDSGAWIVTLIIVTGKQIGRAHV